MSETETPNGMLSFCIFEKACRNRGAATEAISLFLQEVRKQYRIGTMGAFTYSDNPTAQRVLEKNGFRLAEEFLEGGRDSRYYQRKL